LERRSWPLSNQHAGCAAGAGLDVLVGQLKDLKAEREAAELRLTRLEADERDLRAEADAVERLRSQWSEWSVILDAAVANRANAEPGDVLPAIPESSLALARQILRKVLLMPIFVKPTAPGEWAYGGAAAYDGVLHGKIDHQGLVFRGSEFAIKVLRPIAGGSDAEFNRVLGPEMAPHTPQRGGARATVAPVQPSGAVAGRRGATRSPRRPARPRAPARACAAGHRR